MDEGIAAPALVFKIEETDAWRAAEEAGVYRGAAIDARDGFIHLSAAHQVRGTLEKHFAGREQLLLIAIDTARCGDALRWEASRDGAHFPHLYSDLPMDAVVGVQPLPGGASVPSLPEWGFDP